MIDTARERGVPPVALVLGGGYGPVEDVVDIHYETVVRALAGFRSALSTSG